MNGQAQFALKRDRLYGSIRKAWSTIKKHTLPNHAVRLRSNRNTGLRRLRLFRTKKS